MLFSYSRAKHPELVERGIMWAWPITFGSFVLSPFVAIFIHLAIGSPRVPQWLFISGAVVWVAVPMWCFWRGLKLIDKGYET